MQYVSIADLSRMIMRNLHKVPHDIDLVVGIPRSGLLPANMIALYLNIRLTDIDSFVQNKVYSSGYRMSAREVRPIKKILVVDDSVQYGRAIKEAKEKLQVLEKNYEILYLAPIVSSEGSKLVDIYFTVIDDLRLFEWNVFHHNFLSNACLDIDGVLCKDPVIDDDGPLYRDFLMSAEPLFLPTVPVKTLVSCRLEKYRELTEKWLQEHNIQYKELILLDFPDKTARVNWGRHGEYKALCYKKSGATLFIESSDRQAQIIARLSHKPVLCVQTNELLDYGVTYNKFKRFFTKHFPRLLQLIKRLIRKGAQ